MSDNERDTGGKVVTNTEVIETGVVKVEVKCQRGTGTNDRDTIKARAYYEDEEEAREKGESLGHIVRERVREVRSVDENGEIDEGSVLEAAMSDDDSDEDGDSSVPDFGDYDT